MDEEDRLLHLGQGLGSTDSRTWRTDEIIQHEAGGECVPPICSIFEVVSIDTTRPKLLSHITFGHAFATVHGEL